MAEQELRSRITVEGGDQGAKEIGKVVEATEKLGDQTRGSTAETGKATEAQQRLNASESDFVALLMQIDPLLGRTVDGFIRGSRITGDLLTKNIDLASALGKVGAAIKTNAALLGALGLGAVAIFAVVAAVRKMREEMEGATKATRDQIAAMNELRLGERDRKQTLEDLADLRREGGFNPDESRAATEQAERIQQRSPFLDPQAVQRAIALGGEGRSSDEIERIAFLLQDPERLQLDPKQLASTRAKQADRALRRFSGVTDKAFEREDRQQGELFRQARSETSGQVGGSQEAAIAVIEQLTKGEGVDAARLASILQFLGDFEGPGRPPGSSNAFTVGRLESAMERAGTGFGEGGGITERELVVARRVAQEIRNGADLSGMTIKGDVHIHNNQNQRIISPGAARQQKTITNGQNALRNRELVL